MTDKHEERPAEKGTEAAQYGPSAQLYFSTKQGKAWLEQEMKKQEGAK